MLRGLQETRLRAICKDNAVKGTANLASLEPILCTETTVRRQELDSGALSACCAPLF